MLMGIRQWYLRVVNLSGKKLTFIWKTDQSTSPKFNETTIKQRTELQTPKKWKSAEGLTLIANQAQQQPSFSASFLVFISKISQLKLRQICTSSRSSHKLRSTVLWYLFCLRLLEKLERKLKWGWPCRCTKWPQDTADCKNTSQR